MAKEVEKKTEEKRFIMTEISTQTMPVIRDNETGEEFDGMTAMCRIMNDISYIRKSIAN